MAELHLSETLLSAQLRFQAWRLAHPPCWAQHQSSAQGGVSKNIPSVKEPISFLLAAVMPWGKSCRQTLKKQTRWWKPSDCENNIAVDAKEISMDSACQGLLIHFFAVEREKKTEQNTFRSGIHRRVIQSNSAFVHWAPALWVIYQMDVLNKYYNFPSRISEQHMNSSKFSAVTNDPSTMTCNKVFKQFSKTRCPHQQQEWHWM